MNLFNVKLSTRDNSMIGTISAYTPMCKVDPNIEHIELRLPVGANRNIIGVLNAKLICMNGIFSNKEHWIRIAVPEDYDKLTVEHFVLHYGSAVGAEVAKSLYDMFITAGMMLSKQNEESLKEKEFSEDYNPFEDSERAKACEAEKVIEKLVWVACTETELEKKAFKMFCESNGIEVDTDDMYAALFKCTNGDFVVFTFSNDKTIDELKTEIGCSDEVFDDFKEKLIRMFERKDAQAKTVDDLKKVVERSKMFVDRTVSKDNLRKAEDTLTDLAAEVISILNSWK